MVTFVGSPEAVVEAAFRAIRRAAELIDMRKHQGAHPRQGATDVCPFVPVSGVTVEECVELARRLARRVGEELRIPVYLYEAGGHPPRAAGAWPTSASASTRRSPRSWQAGVEARLRPGRVQRRAPAPPSIGARPFLIAYNVNLNTRDDRSPRRSASRIRERGRAERDEAGQKKRRTDGELERVPGLPACRATGWFIKEYGRGQVTINLINYQQTPIHVAFDRVEELAQQLGARVTGSEIVGLVPLEAHAAGRAALPAQAGQDGRGAARRSWCASPC